MWCELSWHGCVHLGPAKQSVAYAGMCLCVGCWPRVWVLSWWGSHTAGKARVAQALPDGQVVLPCCNIYSIQWSSCKCIEPQTVEWNWTAQYSIVHAAPSFSLIGKPQVAPDQLMQSANQNRRCALLLGALLAHYCRHFERHTRKTVADAHFSVQTISRAAFPLRALYSS
jgi:hypothetical protein